MAAALAAAGLVVLAACSGPAPRGAVPSGAGAGSPVATGATLSASVVQYRRDAQRGVLQVKVTNAGATPVHVTHVRLESSTFVAPVEADMSSRIGPGVSADLTVPLGEVVCDDGAADDGGTHRVRLEVDGTSVVLPVDNAVLGPVRAERCVAKAVGEQVDLVVVRTWSDAGEVRGEPVLRGAVVATPRPGATDLALAVEGATTLFTVVQPSTALLAAGATEPAALDVLLSVTRCDPHAVAEDKKGYLLPVRVSVDGAAAVLVEVAIPVPERAPLQDLIDRTCGFG